MKIAALHRLAQCVLLVWAATVGAVPPPAGMTFIPAGNFIPLFRAETDPKSIPVTAFYLDVLPVTNGDFLAFVTANPKWRRSQVKRLFADGDYLQRWAGDL